MPPRNEVYEPLPQPPSARNNTYGAKTGRQLTAKQRLKRYQHDVDLARRVMEPYHKDWKRHIEFYKGNQWLLKNGQDITPRDGIVVNQIASIINTITPAITTEPPTLRATPMRPHDEEKAPLVEAMLNFEYDRLHVNDELILAVKDMLIVGNGWVKVGFEYEATEIKRDPNDIELEVQQVLALQAAALAGEQPTGMGAMGSIGEPAGDELFQLPDVGAAEGAMPEEDAMMAAEQQGVPPEEMAAQQDVQALEEEEGAAVQDEVGAQLQQEGLAQPELPEEAAPPPALLTEDEIRAKVSDTEVVVLKDDIFVERVSPFEVYVDPEARSLDEARWVAQRVVRPLEDVKNDPNYKNTSRLKATEEMKVSKQHGATSPLPEDHLGDYEKRVVVWEYYNLKERTLCVFAEGNDNFLFEGPYTYPFDDSPFVMLRDYTIPDELWAYGEVTMVEGPQVELNKTRTQQLVHNMRFNRKFLYRREAMDQESITALQSNEDGVFVPVAHGQNLSEAIQPIPEQATALPTDRFQMSNVIESDLTTLSGVSDYQRGQFLPRHVTASEANLMSQAQDLRARDKLIRVEKAAAEIGTKMKSLAQTFYDTERWILVTGNGQSVPIQFTKEDIEGNFDVKVDAASTQPTNELFRQQQAERMYQLLRPDPLVKGEELMKQVLEAYGIKNPSRFIMTPEEQFMAQLQQGGMMEGGGIPGMQPGNAEGNINPPAEMAEAVAGGQEAAIP